MRDEQTTPIWLEHPWLWVEELDEDVVVLSVTGGIAANRAQQLWSHLEGVLEQARDRLVVLDLSEVSMFDQASIDILRQIARTAHRRHDDLSVVMRRNSALVQHSCCHGLTGALPIYPFLAMALAGDDSHAALLPAAA